MSRSVTEKLAWYAGWPLTAGALVGFGVDGLGNHPWTGWGDAIAGGVVVLLALAMGTMLGLQIRSQVTGKLTEWAVSSQRLFDQEAESHEKTADVLFRLAYGVDSAASAQAYLAELDSDDEEDESTTENH